MRNRRMPVAVDPSVLPLPQRLYLPYVIWLLFLLPAAAKPQQTFVSTEQQRMAAAPVRLQPSPVRCSFSLLASRADIVRQVLQVYGIEADLDPSLSGPLVSFHADDVDFADARHLVELATATFLVPLDPHHVLVVPDSRENRQKYLPAAIETVDIRALTADEFTDVQNITRTLFGIKHPVARDRQGRLLFYAPQNETSVLHEFFTELFSNHENVQIDIQIYEVDLTRETETGMDPPGSITLFNLRSEINNILANNASLVQQIISSGLASAGDDSAILAALIASGALTGTVFNSPFVLFGGGLTETGAAWNHITTSLLLNSSEVKMLDRTQLRVQDQQDATFRSGQRYPIITSSYTALGSSSSSSLTVPQVQYQDLGLTLKVRPAIEDEHTIRLHVDLQLSALSGASLNSIPVLSHEQYSGTLSVHTEQSALVASLLSRQQEREVLGFPGLSGPSALDSAADHQNTISRKELVVLITPHILQSSRLRTAGPIYALPR
ncbi:MAG: type II and III secretion system protein [Acidobacterium ailaaui]|nr:type II and III secretion system protein [Pseudacidobacterium ailaaui]